MPHRIYMDANATTPVLPDVVDAMRPFWEDRFGNASAVHEHGRGARAAVEGARDAVAILIGANSKEITFTSGGTESDNLAVFGLVHPGEHLVVSALEHDAVLQAAEAAHERGVHVTVLPSDAAGVASLDALKQVLEAPELPVKLVSLMLANNETGVLQPVCEAAAMAHAAGALLHTDAVQALGKLPLDVQTLGCDLMSLSAHKVHGPQGVGALWVRRGVNVSPLLHGGGQERRRRAGTENVAGIAGFGRAAQLAAEHLAAGGAERMCRMRELLEEGLKQRIPEVVVHGQRVPRLPNTVSAAFPGADAEALVIALDRMGLAVSGGSACQSGAVEPSHVLRAMGMSDDLARSSIRLSLSRLNTEDEVDRAVDLVAAAVERLRAI